MDYYVLRYGNAYRGTACYSYRDTALEIWNMGGYDVFHPFFLHLIRIVRSNN